VSSPHAHAQTVLVPSGAEQLPLGRVIGEEMRQQEAIRRALDAEFRVLAASGIARWRPVCVLPENAGGRLTRRSDRCES
jgi:hypothetical protein